MRYFETVQNTLICRLDGETLMIRPWGDNALRVTSRILADPEDTRYALLTPAPTQAEITCTE